MKIPETHCNPDEMVIFVGPTANCLIIEDICEDSLAPAFRALADSISPRQPDMNAVHWHLLEGGIEFEDTDGKFVHVLMDADLLSSLGEKLSSLRKEQTWQGSPS